jgi:hypothetical protein
VTSQVAIRLARAARWKDGLAVGGAALVVLGYFQRASWDTAWGFAKRLDDIWAVWSPLEAFGAAALVALAVLASRRGRLGRDAVDGFVLAVGVIVFAGIAAFLGTDWEFRGTAQLTIVGSVAMAAAGALGLLTRRPPEVGWTRRARVVVSAGFLLGLSPLLVNMGDWGGSGLLETWGGAYYLEVLVAGAVAAVAIIALMRAPRARLRAGGALVAVGLLLTFHYIGLLVQIGDWQGADSIRLGGPIGIVGSVLLVAAGASVLRGERPAEAPATTSVPAT